MHARALLLVLLLGWLSGAPDGARAETKLAFVVGINRYANLKPDFQLQRPGADAEAVSETLSGLGYKVTLLTETVGQELFLRRFTEFTGSIQPGDLALLYFAGHGIALENTNYLLPSDIPALEPGQELLARTRAVSETELRSIMRGRGARVVVVVVDACRDNPFPRTGTRSLGLSRGLVPPEPADGVFSLYSAALGQQALDRLPGEDTDRNSVFTRVFVRQLKKPGLNLIDLGESVRDEVAALVESAHLKQTPAYYNEVRGARRVFLAGAGGADQDRAGTAGARADTPPPSPPRPPVAPAPAPAPVPRTPPAPPPVREAALPRPAPAEPRARFHYLVGLNPRGDNWLALKSAPDIRSARLMKMGPATLLTVIGRQGDWVQVRLRSGQTGWAFARYVACCKEAAP